MGASLVSLSNRVASTFSVVGFIFFDDWLGFDCWYEFDDCCSYDCSVLIDVLNSNVEGVVVGVNLLLLFSRASCGEASPAIENFGLIPAW